MAERPTLVDGDPTQWMSRRWGSGGSLAGLRIGLPINRLQRGTRSHQCLGNQRSQ